MEARDLYDKMQRVITPSGDEVLEAEYMFSPITDRFYSLEIVPSSRPIHTGSSPTLRLPWIDFTIIQRRHEYDKGGYRNFVRDFKRIRFGRTDTRITKKLAGDFFADSSNFG